MCRSVSTNEPEGFVMMRLLSVSLAAVVAVVGLADSVRAANYVVAAPSPTETRTKVQHWVAAQGGAGKHCFKNGQSN